jgi:hypothetical protein
VLDSLLPVVEGAGEVVGLEIPEKYILLREASSFSCFNAEKASHCSAVRAWMEGPLSGMIITLERCLVKE